MSVVGTITDASRQFLVDGHVMQVINGSVANPWHVRDLQTGFKYIPGQFGMELDAQVAFLNKHLSPSIHATMSAEQLRSEAAATGKQLVSAIEKGQQAEHARLPSAGHIAEARTLTDQTQALTMLAATVGDSHSADDAIHDLANVREALDRGQLNGSGGAWNSASSAAGGAGRAGGGY